MKEFLQISMKLIFQVKAVYVTFLCYSGRRQFLGWALEVFPVGWALSYFCIIFGPTRNTLEIAAFKMLFIKIKIQLINNFWRQFALSNN